MDYQKCVEARQCTQPDTGSSCNWNVGGREKHPINCVDWSQAKAFCEWAGKRLLSEAEWEKAARGTDRRKYPWGNEWDAKKANTRSNEDGYEQTAPIGSFSTGASPYEALDMAGNVWEWTADWYDKEQTSRSVRGGSWLNEARHVRVAYRGRYGPGSRIDHIGFRCAQ